MSTSNAKLLFFSDGNLSHKREEGEREREREKEGGRERERYLEREREQVRKKVMD